MCWPTKAMTASPYASTATDTACGRSFPCARCTASLGQVCRGCSTSPSTGSATSIQLAQGKTPPMYPLRQAGQQLQGHGRAGLHREMPACGLFRQTLGPRFAEVVKSLCVRDMLLDAESCHTPASGYCVQMLFFKFLCY